MRRLAVALSVVLASGFAFAQGGVNDLLEGKLVDPKVGQWAWYDLADVASGNHYVIRQAVVGSEKIGKDTGYWVEFEIVPEVGYRSVFKMLLTGPASDPKNIHRVIRKQGIDAAEEVPREEMKPSADVGGERPKRESIGSDDVVTPSGVVRAERTRITKGGQTIDLWINDDVPPTGIVQMRSAQGEMKLRNYGLGGKDAESVLGQTLPADSKNVRVETQIEEAAPPKKPAKESRKSKRNGTAKE